MLTLSKSRTRYNHRGLFENRGLKRGFCSTINDASTRFNHVVIGAGVVGLSVAARLSKSGSVLLIDRNKQFGAETSSRNSEVIHAGLYYPQSSLKTKLCIQGRRLLYQVCPAVGIPHSKVGKWIFATNHTDRLDFIDENFDLESARKSEDFEVSYLEQLKQKSDALGIPTRWISKEKIKRDEPALRAVLALESPETGILDSHSLMEWLVSRLENNGGCLALRSTLIDSTKIERGFRLLIQSEDNPELPPMEVEADCVVNCGGLYADKVAQILMGDKNPYQLYHAKGHYYGYSAKSLVSRLTYPVPDIHLASLGIHTVLDLAGNMRFGPDIIYVPNDPLKNHPDYSFDASEEKKRAFYNAIRRYLPSVDISKLYPDYTGIRPKLAAEGQPFQDFIIKNESNFPTLINLIGIESPGLTSSLAIADEVASMIGEPKLDWVS